MNWEHEKAYCQKRAKELKSELDAAAAASNKEAFMKAYQVAMRYMPKKELKQLYISFIRKEGIEKCQKLH